MWNGRWPSSSNRTMNGRETPRRLAARCVVSCWCSGTTDTALPACKFLRISSRRPTTANGNAALRPFAPTSLIEPSWTNWRRARICALSLLEIPTGVSVAMLMFAPDHQYRINEIADSVAITELRGCATYQARENRLYPAVRYHIQMRELLQSVALRAARYLEDIQERRVSPSAGAGGALARVGEPLADGAAAPGDGLPLVGEV